MSEAINPAELPIMTIADGKNVQIALNTMFDASVFMLKPASLNDAHWWMRDVPYIQVTDGITEEIEPDTGRMIRKTDLQTGKFYVVRDVFLERMAAWYDLKRVGREWKSSGNVVTAKQVKQWIQAALLPFKITAREILDIYQLLDIKCSTQEMQLEQYQIITAETFNKTEHKRPPAIIDGFLYAGLVVLASPPKYGKSFLCLDLCCCVATGKPFWNFSTDAGDVLYCDLEGAAWRSEERLKAVTGSKKAPARLSQIYGVPNVDNGLIQFLEEKWINVVDSPKLIVIDTLQHVKGRVARGEDAYAADTRFMKPLHDLAIRRGISIVAVTHTRKASGFVLDDPFDNILGSVAQYGNSDAGWIISGKRDEEVKTFSAVGRDFEPVSLEIKRSEGGKWICTGTTEEQQELFHRNRYQTDKAVAVIRQQLTGSGGAWRVTAQEFLEIAAKETGEYLEVDATRMGRRIRELAPDLLKYDDILVRWPNKNGGVNGRKITFEQRGYNGNESGT